MKISVVSLLFLLVSSGLSHQSKYRIVRKLKDCELDKSYSNQDVPTLSMCSMLCAGDEECVSAVYDEEEKKCHLFSRCLREVTIDNSSLVLMANSVNCSDSSPIVYKDCQEAHEVCDTERTVYHIQPDGQNQPFEAFCQFDQTSGWTVIQSRVDGSVDFYLMWADYTAGFGNVTGDYWIGLKNIYHLTKTNQKVSIYLEDFDDDYRTANYSTFYIDGADTNYTLHVSGYSGDAEDDMTYHDNQQFSTYDYGPSKVSAYNFKGAWWLKDGGTRVNLNGIYFPGGASTTGSGYPDGIWWISWRAQWYSLKTVYIRVSR